MARTKFVTHLPTPKPAAPVGARRTIITTELVEDIHVNPHKWTKVATAKQRANLHTLRKQANEDGITLVFMPTDGTNHGDIYAIYRTPVNRNSKYITDDAIARADKGETVTIAYHMTSGAASMLRKRAHALGLKTSNTTNGQLDVTVHLHR